MRTHQLHVDRHTSSTQINSRTSSGDTSYTVHLVGGSLSSCDVGYRTYTSLKDGDSVEVQSSHLFKKCISVTRDGEVIETSRYWRLFELIGAMFLIAAAIGWLKSGDDDADGMGFRVG